MADATALKLGYTSRISKVKLSFINSYKRILMNLAQFAKTHFPSGALLISTLLTLNFCPV